MTSGSLMVDRPFAQVFFVVTFGTHSAPANFLRGSLLPFELAIRGGVGDSLMPFACLQGAKWLRNFE
jgi:hypothetical protein